MSRYRKTGICKRSENITMKIAVFSDVHGNLKSLKAIFEQIKEMKVDQIVFLGDIFQRGNEEIECLDFLEDNDILCLKGNCELYAECGVEIDPDVEYLRDYYDGMRKKLTYEQIQFIKQMPLYYEKECYGKTIRFSHFLFSDINLAYPFLQLSSMQNGLFDKVCESKEITKYDLVVIGHSHRNFVKGNVLSVSATGLEGSSFVLIVINEDDISFEHIPMKVLD